MGVITLRDHQCGFLLSVRSFQFGNVCCPQGSKVCLFEFQQLFKKSLFSFRAVGFRCLTNKGIALPYQLAILLERSELWSGHSILITHTFFQPKIYAVVVKDALHAQKEA